MKSKIIILIALCTLSFNVTAQIAVSPLAIFVDNNTRSGEMTIFNQGAQPKEINIMLTYGYVDYDSLGRSFLNMDDTITSKESSIAPYLSVYPKKLIIQPGTSQKVKLMVKNTNSLLDGTYWTRIITESKDIKKQIDSTNIGDKVSVGLSIKFNMVSAFIFQKGKLNTDVKLNSVETKTDTLNTKLLLSFKREGNSPFFGTCKINIFDDKGDEITSKDETFAAYFEGKRAFEFSNAILKPGRYKADFTLTNEQPDVPDDRKIPFEEVTKTFEFIVE